MARLSEPEHKTVSPTYFQWWRSLRGACGVCEARARYQVALAVRFRPRSEAIHNEKGRHPGPDTHGASGAGMWRVLPVSERSGLRAAIGTSQARFSTEYEGRMIVGSRVVAQRGSSPNQVLPGPGSLRLRRSAQLGRYRHFALHANHTGFHVRNEATRQSEILA